MRAQRLPVLTLLVTLGCEPYGALPAGLSATLEGTGPRVLFNLEARPLPEIPFPNDLATLPDPTSPTGRRLNLSLIGPTLLESGVRAKADRLDGFGTFSPISVRFDAPIDPNALRALHLDRDPKNDAVLVVDVDPKSPEFGRVAPLDLGYYAELPEAMKVSPSQRSPRTGRFPSYSIVTWLFESGRSQSTSLFCRASVSLFRIRCDREIGSGISSGVSLQA